jgi:superfamily I DNA/RNA helicase
VLTPEQHAAATTNHHSICVMSGAGTGKTKTIVARVCYLVENGLPPQSIALITFSKRAAQELKDRLIQEDEQLANCLVGTFHAVAYELMQTKPSVLDPEVSQRMLEDCYKATGSKLSSAKLTAESEAYRIGLALNTVKPGTNTAVDMYLSRLAVNGEADYLSLLTWLVNNTDRVWLSSIMVDEAQDNEPLQWEIIKRFVNQGADLCVVMDPRQMIYGWRGADHQTGLDITEEMFALTRSFRTPRDVTALANLIAQDIDQTLPLLQTCKRDDGITVTSRSALEAVEMLKRDGYGDDDIVVLCRTNRTCELIRDELKRGGHCVAETILKERRLAPLLQYLANPEVVPFGLTDIKSEIISPAFLSASWDEAPPVVALRVENWLNKIGRATCDVLRDITFLDSDLDNEISLWNNTLGSNDLREALSRRLLFVEEAEVTSGLRVMTIHQSKGLEFPAVIAAAERFASQSPEELRLAYVQVTRAIDRLVILDNANAPGYLQKLARKFLVADLLSPKSVCTLNDNGDTDGIGDRQTDSERTSPADDRGVRDPRTELLGCG